VFFKGAGKGEAAFKKQLLPGKIKIFQIVAMPDDLEHVHVIKRYPELYAGTSLIVHNSATSSPFAA
jgi:hypothetical protein